MDIAKANEKYSQGLDVEWDSKLSRNQSCVHRIGFRDSLIASKVFSWQPPSSFGRKLSNMLPTRSNFSSLFCVYVEEILVVYAVNYIAIMSMPYYCNEFIQLR